MDYFQSWKRFLSGETNVSGKNFLLIVLLLYVRTRTPIPTSTKVRVTNAEPREMPESATCMIPGSATYAVLWYVVVMLSATRLYPTLIVCLVNRVTDAAGALMY